MLLDLDPGVQRLNGVAGLYRDRHLFDDGTVVDFLVDEVDSDTGRSDAVIESVLDGVRARKRRQQRRVDVEHSIGESIEKNRSQDAHEPGEHDALGPTLLDGVSETGAEGLTVPVPGQSDSGNTCRLGPTQRPGSGVIGDDEGDVRPHRRDIDQCLQVGARTRCENCDVDVGPPDLGAAAV